MEKNVAISILKDIQKTLMDNNWKEKSLQTIEIYEKGIEVATNEKIKKMINKHSQYIMLYGEADKKTIKLAKKIDKEMQKIYNK